MLGSYLRSGREEAGLSLDTVAAQTKIPRRNLEALEQERLSELPPIVFVRGFVRAYCSVVGADPTPALELLESHSGVDEDADSRPTDGRKPIYLTPSTLPTGRGLRISRLVLVLVAVALFVAAYILTGGASGDRDRSAAAGGGTPPPGIERPVPHTPAPPGPGDIRPPRTVP